MLIFLTVFILHSLHSAAAQNPQNCTFDSQCKARDKPFCLGGQCKAPYCPGDASLGPTPQAKKSPNGTFLQCTAANAQTVCAPAGPACPTCNTYYCETLERGFCCPNTKNPVTPCQRWFVTVAGSSCSTYGPYKPTCPLGAWCSGRPGVCCKSPYYGK